LFSFICPNFCFYYKSYSIMIIHFYKIILLLMFPCMCKRNECRISAYKMTFKCSILCSLAACMRKSLIFCYLMFLPLVLIRFTNFDFQSNMPCHIWQANENLPCTCQTWKPALFARFCTIIHKIPFANMKAWHLGKSNKRNLTGACKLAH